MYDHRTQPQPYPQPYPSPDPRGYYPPSPQPGGWPDPPPPPPPRRRKGRILVPVLVAVVVALIGFAIKVAGRVAAGDAIRPTSSPSTTAAPATSAPAVTLSAFDLQAGDCYNAAPLPTDGTTQVVASVKKVQCTQPHTGQVVAVPDYAGRSHDEAVNTLSVADCTREFRAKLRSAALANKRYRLGQIFPDALAWSRSTSVACVVATDAPTTGSALKG
jgi:hypothetical protein